MLRFALFTLLLVTTGSVATATERVARSDLQAVVTAQIAAFDHDDAAAAIGFAAPAIQDKFKDGGTFLAMVRAGYAPLLHARHLDFGDVTDTSAGPAQAVTIVAADGAVWRALYTFERVGDAWRISGCVLAKDEGTAI